MLQLTFSGAIQVTAILAAVAHFECAERRTLDRNKRGNWYSTLRGKTDKREEPEINGKSL